MRASRTSQAREIQINYLLFKYLRCSSYFFLKKHSSLFLKIGQVPSLRGDFQHRGNIQDPRAFAVEFNLKPLTT